LTTLHQWESDTSSKKFQLFNSRPTLRMRGGSGRASSRSGGGPTGGAHLRIYLKEKLADGEVARIEITDPAGELAKVMSTKPDKKKKESSLDLKAGMNTITWNMRYESAESFGGMVLWGGGTGGPMAVPGEYTATLSIGTTPKKGDKSDDSEGEADEKDETEEEADSDKDDSTESASITFAIAKDPRASATDDDLQAQFDFLIGVRDKLTETHKSIKRLRDVRGQIDALMKRIRDKEEYKELRDKAKEIVKNLTTVEEKLYQTKNQAPQDPLNFPIRLNNRLSALVSVVASGDNRPTDQAYKVRDELIGLIDAEVEKLNSALDDGIEEFNAAVKKADIPAIFVDGE